MNEFKRPGKKNSKAILNTNTQPKEKTHETNTNILFDIPQFYGPNKQRGYYSGCSL